MTESVACGAARPKGGLELGTRGSKLAMEGCSQLGGMWLALLAMAKTGI